MDLSKFFAPETVLYNVAETNRDAILQRLIDAMMLSPAVAHSHLTREQVETAILQRENERQTVLGNGIAMPHGRVPEIRGAGFAVATLAQPVDWNGPEPVRVIILFVAPREQPPVALKILSNIALLALDDEARKRLFALGSAQEVHRFLSEKLMNIDIPLRARDVMRPPFFSLLPETPLTTVVHTMLEHRVEAAGITDSKRRLLGEVTSDRLLTLGMPDFFFQLKSVSFISDFDPFERYFEQESQQTAGEVLSKDVATVAEDATILEVIFLLSVRRYPKVYVVNDGMLVGVIDRTRVLDVILNV